MGSRILMCARVRAGVLSKGQWGGVDFWQRQGPGTGWGQRKVLECNRGQARARGNLEFVVFFYDIFFFHFSIFMGVTEWA